MVVYEIVVWICNPEAGWSLIGVKKTPRSLCHNDEVSCDVVVSFNAVFDEDCVAHAIVSNIICNSQILVSMDCKSSVERGVDSVTQGIRFMNSTNKMEMNRISTDFEGLSNLRKLSV